MDKLHTLLFLTFITLFISCSEGDGLIIPEEPSTRNIATVSQQITAIEHSIQVMNNLMLCLEDFKKDKNHANDISRSDTTADELKNEIANLKEQIEELQKYIDSVIVSKEWLDATFCTLEKHEETVALLASIQIEIDCLKEQNDILSNELYNYIRQQIDSSTESTKNWVSDYLTGYYDIAQVDILIQDLQNMAEDADEKILEEIENIKQALEVSKDEMSRTYHDAIKTAITQNNGYIEDIIAERLTEINNKITQEIAEQNKRIDEIDERLKKLENSVENLLKRIQSVSYIPINEDKVAHVNYPNDTTTGAAVKLDFMISPKNTINELVNLYKDILKVKAFHVGNTTPIELPIYKCIGDSINGILSIEADAESLGMDFYNDKKGAMAALHISDGNNDIVSEYISMIPKHNFSPNNQIWYTTLNNTPISICDEVETHEYEYIYQDCFGVRLISHGYNSKQQRYELIFEDEIKHIGIDNILFVNSEYINNIWLPSGIYNNIGLGGLNRLEKIYSKYSTEDKRCYIINEELLAVATGGIHEYILPNNIKKIMGRVFENSNIQKIILGENVKEIHGSAFADCKQLTNIELGKSIERIYEYAFKNCEQLVNLELGEAIKEIRYEAFKSCSNLTDVYILNQTPPSVHYTSFDNCSDDLKFHIPEGSYINYINSNWPPVYKDRIVTDETYPNDNIPEEHTIKYQTNDGKIVNIKNDHFGIARALYTKYENNEGIIYLDTIPTMIGSTAFLDCANLTSIDIPNKIESIEYKAFSGCINLKEITIKNNIKTIDGEAFYGCSNLTDVYFTNQTPPSLGYKAFTYSKNLKLHIPDGSYHNYIKSGWETEMLKMLFINDGSDKDYTITFTTSDGGEIEINSDKFGEANILFTLYDNEYGEIYLDDIPTCVTDEMFAWCQNLKDIKLGNEITTIGNSAFYACESLERITIPDKVVTIGDNAFTGCQNVKELKLGKKVKQINNGAFMECGNFESIVFPDGVMTIERDAFRGCAQLQIVTFGKNVTTIGAEAFFDCNITKMYFNGATPPTIEEGLLFEDWKDYKDIEIYVPEEFLQTYLNSNLSEEIKEIIRRTYYNN